MLAQIPVHQNQYSRSRGSPCRRKNIANNDVSIGKGKRNTEPKRKQAKVSGLRSTKGCTASPGAPQASITPKPAIKHIVISTPSPVREGTSYLAATKTFIPPLPLDTSTRPVISLSTSSNHSKDSPPKSHYDDTKNEAANAKAEPSLKVVVDRVIQAAKLNRIAVSRVLMVIFLAFVMQTTRCLIPIVASMIIALSLMVLVQRMDLPSKIISAVGLRYTQCFFSLFCPDLNPEPLFSNFIFLIVILIIAMALVQGHEQVTSHQKKLLKERRIKEQEEKLLLENKLREQALKDVWQHNEKKRLEQERSRLSHQAMLREQEKEGSKRYRRYGSFNNHDDQKRQYLTQDEAEQVIAGMRRQGKDKGTLVSYYNPHYCRWFVGNKWPSSLHI